PLASANSGKTWPKQACFTRQKPPAAPPCHPPVCRRLVGVQLNWSIFVFRYLTNEPKMRLLTAEGMALILAGCSISQPDLKQGVWRGVLRLQDQELAFNFAIRADSAGAYDAFIKNGSENLLLDEVYFQDDSLVMRLHIFDAELRAAIDGD